MKSLQWQQIVFTVNAESTLMTPRQGGRGREGGGGGLREEETTCLVNFSLQ